MNTTKYVLGEIYVLFCPDQKQPYTLHLRGDEVWYDGRHGLTKEPKGFVLAFSQVLDRVKAGATPPELCELFQVPENHQESFNSFVEDLKFATQVELPKQNKVANLGIASARRLVGLAPIKSRPSPEVAKGAAKLRLFVLSWERKEAGKWPLAASRIHAGRQKLLGLSMPVSEKKLLSPLSDHIVLAEPGEVCVLVRETGFDFGLLAGYKPGHMVGPMPVFMIPSKGLFKPTVTTAIFAVGVNRLREALGDPRTLDACKQFEWLGEAFCATTELLKRLRASERNIPTNANLPPGLDPEQVLGVPALRLRGFPVPPLGLLVQLHLLAKIRHQQEFPLEAHKVRCQIERVWAAALALRN